MLADKGKLIEQARLKLHESGYVYSKGKSRSKILNPEVTKHDKPRRERIDKKERKHRIESLQDEMKDINKHVTVKERRIEQAQAAKNFKICDQLSDEITKLKAKRRELDSRLWAILHKEKRSKHYFARRKSNPVQESDTEEEIVSPHAHKKKCKDPVIIDSESELSSEKNCSEETDVEPPSNDEATTSRSFL